MDSDLADCCRRALLQQEWAEALAMLARAAVDAGLCDHAGVAEIVDDGTFRTVVSSDLVVHELNELQYPSGQGPCIEAIRQPGVLHCDDAVSDPRWPAWRMEAGRRKIGGVVSVHLGNAVSSLGALTLYSQGARIFTTDDLDAVALVGAHASVALAHLHDTEHLWKAIDARHRIGQAQGILMERFDITADAAFSLLRRLSQESHVKLHLIADQVVRTRTLPTTSDLRPGGQPAVRAPRSPDLVLPRAT